MNWIKPHFVQNDLKSTFTKCTIQYFKAKQVSMWPIKAVNGNEPITDSPQLMIVI